MTAFLIAFLYITAGLATATWVARAVNESGHGFEPLPITPRRVAFIVALWPVFVAVWLQVVVLEPLVKRVTGWRYW